MKLLFAAKEKEADAEQFDDAPSLVPTTVPERDNVAPETEGTYPTEFNYDKKMFQACVASFQPSAREVAETAGKIHNGVVKQQLVNMLFDDAVWFGEICAAAEVEAKSRWLVVPPKGHEDLGKKMLILRNKSVQIMHEDDNVVKPSNTHQFHTPKEAQDWIDRTINQLKQAQYKVI